MGCLFLFFCTKPAFSNEVDLNEAYTEISWEELISQPNSIEFDFDNISENNFSQKGLNPDDVLATYIQTWNAAPINLALINKRVKISGFVVPLDRNEDSGLSAFLLVPYYGACIHVPPPPLNQIIYVQLETPQIGIEAMDQISIYGVLTISTSIDTPQNAAYSFYAVKIEMDRNLNEINFFIALCISLISGFSVLFGLIFAFFVKNTYLKLFSLGIAFAAGIMTCLGISIILIDLSLKSIAGFSVGILLALSLKKLFHHQENVNCITPTNASGISTMFAIAIHGIPEVFAIFSMSLINPVIGLILAGTMVLHTIPLGFSFALPHISHRWRYALLSGLIPVVISILIYTFAKSLFMELDLVILFSFVGGMMVFIAIKELLPAAAKYSSFYNLLCGYLFGVVFILIILFSIRLQNAA